MYDKDEIKNSLSLEQVIELILACGASYPTVRADMFMAENICHNLPGDSKGKRLYYYDNTKLFRCYTDCGDIFDIFDLVAKTRKIQYDQEWGTGQCVRWVADFFGIQPKVGSFDNVKENVPTVMNFINKMENALHKRENMVHDELLKYDDSILKYLKLVPSFEWLNEGITKATMIRYGIKYYPTSEKIVIPHRNENGELIGIRGRALIKEDAEMFGKYMPLKIGGKMYNHPLSFSLYGLYENKENIKHMKKAIIFEGEKSVMLYDSLFGSENNITVASCGSSLSSFQVELLLSLGVEEVIIAYDRQFQEIGDNEFKNHTKALTNIVNKFEKQIKVTIMFDKWNLLDYKDAPIDKGKETFITLYKNRITI